MEDKRIKLMRDEPVHKAINSMAIPSIIGLMVMAIYNIVDTMFVSWLGTEATGATQVVLPIVMVVSSIGLTFGMGGGGYVSRLLGADNKTEANKVASVSFGLSFLIGIILTILLISLLSYVLSFFGASGGVLIEAKKYGLFIAIGGVFMTSNMTLNNLLRGDGSSKLSMIAMATGTILNIILDPIFIFVFKMGITGAAIATTISQAVSFIILISTYLKKKSVVEISIKYFKPSKVMMMEIMKIGIPTFIRQVLFSISLGFLNRAAMGEGGEDLLAAVGLVFRITMLPMYIIFGLAQGFQPVVGYNFGAKNQKRVNDSLKYTLIAGFVISVFSCLMLIIFSRPMIGIFKPDPKVMDLGIRGLLFFSFSLLLMSFNNTISVFFQAIGKGKQSIILALSRQGIFYIPLCLILPRLLGKDGVLLVQPFADVITLILTSVLIVVYRIKSKKIKTDYDDEPEKLVVNA